MRNYILVALMAAGTLLSTGCKKEGCTDSAANNYDSDAKSDNGSCTYNVTQLRLMVDPVVGTEEFHYGHVYTGHNGVKYSFDRVNFYLSDLTLMHDGGTHALSESHILVDPMTTAYDLGEIDAGHYHGLSMSIGVDETSNKVDPTTYNAGHPLAPQDPSMYWSWAAGYKFIVLEGQFDSDADDVPDMGFVFHVGTDALLRSHMAESHFDATQYETNMVHLTMDMGKFLDGIDLTVDNSTHTSNNLPLATTVADNAHKVFSH